MEILEKHKDQFGTSFEDNKKSLDQISIIRSKELKNEIAGFITKFIKHEILDKKKREEKLAKQAKINEESEEENLDMDEAKVKSDSQTVSPSVQEKPHDISENS